MSAPTRLRLISFLMWFVAISHIAMGLALLGPRRFRDMVASLYQANVDWTPQFDYILRPLGVFLIGLGLLASIAARRPAANRGIIAVFALMLAVRASQRLVHSQDIVAAFGTPAPRLYLQAAFFGVVALFLGAAWFAGRPRSA